eukprot:CAMPEP_0174895634 /NCGR_PEP_ID=MMETSP0167-20121228/10004_1 /TAXON_ID=38298 /ORGANISM="Rhodella maculata, Strain CCMP736" /LENGTH=356 /DNA_ID=CAMNT_0016135017 /DNA_START=124 /DNA_END=1194 /DNA_ORIENTATION=+
MAQQCACSLQFDVSESCLSFIGGGPACESTTCNPYYLCNPEGESLCEVSTTAITVIRPIEGTGQCTTELVDPATVTTLVQSTVKSISDVATSSQTVPAATPAGNGPIIDVLVEFFTSATDCTVSWLVVNDVAAGSTFTGPPSAAHIHGPASPGTSAGVLITLFSDPSLATGTAFIAGTPVEGSAVVPLSTCETINNGLAYFNIHTAANPPGEARAHLMYNTDISLTSAGTDGSGTASITLGEGEVCINSQFGMTNVPTNAHIHAPAPLGSNAGVIVPLFQDLNNVGGINYVIQGCNPVTVQEYNWIRDGLAYINIHTAEIPSGELRGQISSRTGPAPSPSRELLTMKLAAMNAKKV